MSASRKPRRVMPLRVRIPAIVVGIFVLTWMMRGGASVVVNGIVDAIRPVDRTISGAAERAATSRPESTAWIREVLERLSPHMEPGGALEGLEVVIYDESIADESIDGGRIQTGPFYDPPSARIFVDVAYLAILDRYVRPAKGYFLARALAQHAAPDAEGAAFEEAAGALALTTGLIPPRWRAPGTTLNSALALEGADRDRARNKPPGWRLPPMGSALPAEEAARAFTRGLGAAGD
ncbi:MAG: hypothetical protein VXW31_00820 [Planctomycetota bacterium]|nr:hypothetical protein [Planctomycetota bacterium]